VRHGRHRAAQPGQGHLRAGSAKRGDDKPGTVVMHMHGLDKIASAPALAAPAALTRPGPPRPWQLLYPSLPPLPPGWNKHPPLPGERGGGPVFPRHTAVVGGIPDR